MSAPSAVYAYQRFRIPACGELPATTVAMDWDLCIRLTCRAGGPRALSLVLRAEATRIRREGFSPGQTFSAAVRRAVQARLQDA